MNESIVINEAMARSLGWDESVGRSFDITGETSGSRVVGVVKDFHYKSLREAIEPLAVYYAPRGAMMSIRFQGEEVAGVLEHVEEVWNRFETVYPFEYAFLDEQFEAFIPE